MQGCITFIVFPFPAECVLEKEIGDCTDYTRRFYFDARRNTCRKFNYGGCGGNENNFRNKNACTNHCKVSECRKIQRVV